MPMEKWGQERSKIPRQEPDAIVWVRQRDGLAGDSGEFGGSRQSRDTLRFGQLSNGTFPKLTSSMASNRSLR